MDSLSSSTGRQTQPAAPDLTGGQRATRDNSSSIPSAPSQQQQNNTAPTPNPQQQWSEEEKPQPSMQGQHGVLVEELSECRVYMEHSVCHTAPSGQGAGLGSSSASPATSASEWTRDGAVSVPLTSTGTMVGSTTGRDLTVHQTSIGVAVSPPCCSVLPGAQQDIDAEQRPQSALTEPDKAPSLTDRNDTCNSILGQLSSSASDCRTTEDGPNKHKQLSLDTEDKTDSSGDSPALQSHDDTQDTETMQPPRVLRKRGRPCTSSASPSDKLKTCGHCNRQFPLARFAAHRRTCKGQEGSMQSHACEECGKKFLWEVSLKKHQQTQHGSPGDSAQLKQPARSLKSSRDRKAVCNKAPTSTRFVKKHATDSDLKTMSQVKNLGVNDRFKKNKSGVKNHEVSDNRDRKCFKKRPHLKHHADGDNRSKNEKKPYFCSQCQQKFSYKGSLRRHQLMHTGAKPFECKTCQKCFTRYAALKSHVDSMHFNYRPFECPVCNKGFSQKNTLTVHMRVHSDKRPFVCDQCGKSFNHACVLNEHKKLHSGDRAYRCEVCQMSYHQAGSLAKHMMRKHADPSLPRPPPKPPKAASPCVCHICGKVLVSLKSLQLHELTHVENKEKPFVCGQCHKAFATRPRLKKHQRTHSDIKPFSCQLCQKAFTRSDALKNHQAVFHLDRGPFVCQVCGKGWSNKNSLRIHMLVHSDTRPFACDACQKTFKYAASLTAHKKLHASDRPFKCQLCGEGFITAFYLARHNARKHAEPEYICDICAKGFPLASGLNRHKAVHADLTPFACDVCGKVFKYESSMKRHRQSHNPSDGKSSFSLNPTDSSRSACINPADHQSSHSLSHADNRPHSQCLLQPDMKGRTSQEDVAVEASSVHSVCTTTPVFLPSQGADALPQPLLQHRHFLHDGHQEMMLSSKAVSQTVPFTLDGGQMSNRPLYHHQGLVSAVRNPDTSARPLSQSGVFLPESSQVIYHQGLISTEMKQEVAGRPVSQPHTFLPEATGNPQISDSTLCHQGLVSPHEKQNMPGNLLSQHVPLSCTGNQETSCRPQSTLGSFLSKGNGEIGGRSLLQQGTFSHEGSEAMSSGRLLYHQEPTSQSHDGNQAMSDKPLPHHASFPADGNKATPLFTDSDSDYSDVDGVLDKLPSPCSNSPAAHHQGYHMDTAQHNKPSQNLAQPQGYLMNKSPDNPPLSSPAEVTDSLHALKSSAIGGSEGVTDRFTLDQPPPLQSAENENVPDSDTRFTSLKTHLPPGAENVSDTRFPLSKELIPSNRNMTENKFPLNAALFPGNVDAPLGRLASNKTSEPDVKISKFSMNMSPVPTADIKNDSRASLDNSSESDNTITYATDRSPSPETEIKFDLSSLSSSLRNTPNKKTDDSSQMLKMMDINNKQKPCHKCSRKFSPAYFLAHKRKCRGGKGERKRGRKKGRKGRGGGKCHQCGECGKSFLWAVSLRVHRQSEHGGETEEHSHSHLHSEHGGETEGQSHSQKAKGQVAKPFVCAKCGRAFASRSSLRRHEQLHTGVKPFQCQTCHKSFTRAAALHNHVNALHLNRKPHVCPVCCKGFSQKETLNMHMRTHSDERPFVCQLCQKAFKHACTLKEHTKLHSGEKAFQCGDCAVSYNTAGSLAKHRSRKHADPSKPQPKPPKQPTPCVCLVCGKVLANLKSLHSHEMTHSGERIKPYVCAQCGQAFSLKCNLRRHHLVHEGAKPFQCETCHKCFTRSAALKSHQDTYHLDVRPHVCLVCHKGFSQKSSLNVHMRCHMDARPFACDVCDKAFKHTSTLKEHRKLHSSHRPFTCTVCGESCISAFTLARHTARKHSAPQFICSICAKGFHFAAELNRHKAVHADVVPFPCDLCSKSFKYESSLKRHQLTHNSSADS